MNKSDNLSLLEVAVEYMNGKKTPQKISKIIEDVLSIKGLDADDYDSMAKLYSDITTSAKFVFCGEEEWDLKERQSLDLWDKDGSYFNKDVDDDDIVEDDEMTIDDYSLDEEEDESDDVDSDDEEEENEDDYYMDSDEEDDDDYDEDKYNDVMDDYEDLYDED